MDRRVELGEILPLDDIPSSLQKRLPQNLRQSLHALQVFRVVLHQIGVFGQLGRDEHPAPTVLTHKRRLRLCRVNKVFLYPCVPNIAGVRGESEKSRCREATANTGTEIDKLVIGEVCRFVQPDHIEFRALILKYIVLIGAVSEPNGRPVPKRSNMLGRIVPIPWFTRKVLEMLLDERTFQFHECPPQHQLCRAGVIDGIEQSRNALCRALAAACRPSVHDLIHTALEYELLLLREQFNVQLRLFALSLLPGCFLCLRILPPIQSGNYELCIFLSGHFFSSFLLTIMFSVPPPEFNSTLAFSSFSLYP